MAKLFNKSVLSLKIEATENKKDIIKGLEKLVKLMKKTSSEDLKYNREYEIGDSQIGFYVKID